MPEPKVETSGTPRGSDAMRRSLSAAGGYRMASWRTGSPAVTPVVWPTIVVRGERDALVPRPWAEEVTRLVPRARPATVPDSPHTVPFRAPEALAALVTEFVRQDADASG